MFNQTPPPKVIKSHIQTDAEIAFAMLTPLEQAKSLKIKELHDKDNLAYSSYLSSYPKKEQESFPIRSSEAIAYMKDNTTLTPATDIFVGFDNTKTGADLDIEIAKRVAHIADVYPKAVYILQSTAQVVETRDYIKSLETIEEVQAVEI